MQTAVFSNAANPSQQVRVTTTPRAYDAALTATIWNDFFDHLARWTSSANGDVGSKLTHAEVDKTFDVKTIDVGGGQQPYTYYVKTPSTYRPGQHLPVVISAHGANVPAWLYLSQIKMHELGEREGFITVYPNAHNNMWDFTRPDGGDQKFIRQIVADVIRDYGVDSTRVYMQGFSFGSGMTYMMGISYPGLFAAVSPNNGIGPMSKEVNAWVDGLKAKGDIRIPMMIVYGAVDSGASVDATIPAQGVLRDAIDQIKTYNHISTSDRYVRFDSLNSAPYDMLVPGPKLEPAAVDARYPAGRFQVYKYASADPKPLSLFQFVWVTDLPHGADLREAKLEWDYFKHWRRNADGSLAFIP
jgi:poly(3-hydroxybutyrate) depolymerase